MFRDIRDSDPYQKTILCFCGDSDVNGDWIINRKNKDDIQTISFNDIESLLRRSDGTLSIITDCSYSEKWIIECDKISSNYWNKKAIIIQASARKDELEYLCPNIRIHV